MLVATTATSVISICQANIFWMCSNLIEQGIRSFVGGGWLLTGVTIQKLFTTCDLNCTMVADNPETNAVM